MAVKTGTTNHPKFRRLQKQLKLPTYAVAGLLELLWMLTTQFASEDGDIGRFSNQEIADYCDYEGDADSLVTALVDCKWLDRDADSLQVHDWLDHRPSFIDDRIRIRESRKKSKDFDACSPDVREQSETVANNRPQPSQAKPSQTNSNQQLASLPAAADLDLFWKAGQSSVEEIRSCANRLLKAFPSMDRAVVWRIAWVAWCVDRGMPGDLIAKIRDSDKPVRKPVEYIKAVLRGELSKLGIDLDMVLARIPSPPPVKEVVMAGGAA